jgi:hypothetical protein
MSLAVVLTSELCCDISNSLTSPEGVGWVLCDLSSVWPIPLSDISDSLFFFDPEDDLLLVDECDLQYKEILVLETKA